VDTRASSPTNRALNEKDTQQVPVLPSGRHPGAFDLHSVPAQTPVAEAETGIGVAYLRHVNSPGRALWRAITPPLKMSITSGSDWVRFHREVTH
jgi:hypothetical protein